jgi:CBS domain-containing protein
VTLARLEPKEAIVTVKTILSAKGSDVITIEPNATLATAAKLLTTHNIGAVVICGLDRRDIGILSERDIVRAIVDSDLLT